MSKKQEVLSGVETIFRKIMNEPTIPFHERLASADVALWDSMKNIEFLLAVEKAFSIRFDADEAFGLANIGELVTLIVRKVN